MRHTANILIGTNLKSFAARLGKYVLKYGEASASSYFTSVSWVYREDGKTEIMKAVRDDSTDLTFISDMQDLYKTKLEELKTLEGQDRTQDIRLFFRDLHQDIVTINNPGDSNSLLVALYVPLYDSHACEEAIRIIESTTDLRSHFTIILVGLCEDLGHIISPEEFLNISAEEETNKKTTQKDMLNRMMELKNHQTTLEQIVILQNANAEGFALNLDSNSFMRIIGELALICVEKYNTIFTQAAEYDREHPFTALGLSVMNLDKYYFENYLLRRAYIRILEREDVMVEEVDLNKAAIVANRLLAKHKTFFSDFYGSIIAPKYRQNENQDTIISQIADPLRDKFKEVTDDLTSYMHDPDYSLPEKQAILAMVLGYDDSLLKGNLFTEQQLTLDNLDEEVANFFIEANNACVIVNKSDDPEEEDEIIYGPLGDLCANEEGKVSLPIDELQKLRNDIRQSTNYIREKNKELEEIKSMKEEAKASEKRLTEDGFIIDGKVYKLEAQHEEVRFDETYEPKKVTEKIVDLRNNFTEIKDQGEIGSCTAFSIVSIYEYILKKNTQKYFDLSESFVYYNVRHAEGREAEDTGSSFNEVIMSIGEQGVCTESLHPYVHALSDKPSEDAYADAQNRRIKKAYNVNISKEDIKSAIQEGYPVAISLKIYNSFYSTTGFVERPSAEELKSTEYGYHAMVIVGYSDETKHFVVRNSWGEQFGDHGYCYIPYLYICDPELNRMACIVKEVDYSGGALHVEGTGGSDKKQIAQFNMSDARIKSYIIKNLLDEEQEALALKQEEDAKIRTEYEKLMQMLGKQSVRTQILNDFKGNLSVTAEKLKQKRDYINQTERVDELRHFDKESWKTKFRSIGIMLLLAITWYVCYYLINDIVKWLENDWCWILLGLIGLDIVFFIMYWWYVKSQRRKLEIEYEEKTAEMSLRINKIIAQSNEQKLKMHVAGMFIDNLLTLKSSLDTKYQGMKSYVGNLAVWYQEERRNLETMEPLIKDPFIPLLSNEQLNIYFEESKEEITKGLHLYEYFDSFKMDEEGIIQYERQLKQNILDHVKTLLKDFTIFRHIFASRDYPYLDKKYASAENLLPKLDGKSVPFCRIKKTAVTKPEARFLFIHTDPEEKTAWEASYPKHFKTKPISESIVSIFKIICLRLQILLQEEAILD